MFGHQPGLAAKQDASKVVPTVWLRYNERCCGLGWRWNVRRRPALPLDEPRRRVAVTTGRFWAVLILLFIGVVQARVGENAELDRSIAKELGYESKEFGYWRLAVGSEVNTGVYVVANGDILHVDRKGDRGLAGADEQVPLKDGRSFQTP